MYLTPVKNMMKHPRCPAQLKATRLLGLRSGRVASFLITTWCVQSLSKSIVNTATSI